MASCATEGRRLLESELQGVEDEERRQRREEQARKEQEVEDAVQEMRYCGAFNAVFRFSFLDEVRVRRVRE